MRSWSSGRWDLHRQRPDRADLRRDLYGTERAQGSASTSRARKRSDGAGQTQTPTQIGGCQVNATTRAVANAYVVVLRRRSKRAFVVDPRNKQ